MSEFVGHPGKYDPKTSGHLNKWINFVKIGDIYSPVKKEIFF